MNGFAKRAELIREKIKKTVMEMLKTWEPRKIRIADIAAEANVSQVTIYNYFGSKEALLREAFKDYMEKSFADFESFIATEPTMKEIVQYSLTYDREAIHSYSPDFFRQFLIDDREMYEYMEELYRERAVKLIVRLIEERKKRGEISSKLSTSSILLFFNMFKDKSKEVLDMAQQSGDPEGFVEEIIRLFYYGLHGER